MQEELLNRWRPGAAALDAPRRIEQLGADDADRRLIRVGQKGHNAVDRICLKPHIRIEKEEVGRSSASRSLIAGHGEPAIDRVPDQTKIHPAHRETVGRLIGRSIVDHDHIEPLGAGTTVECRHAIPQMWARIPVDDHDIDGGLDRRG